MQAASVSPRGCSSVLAPGTGLSHKSAPQALSSGSRLPSPDCQRTITSLYIFYLFYPRCQVSVRYFFAYPPDPPETASRPQNGAYTPDGPSSPVPQGATPPPRNPRECPIPCRSRNLPRAARRASDRQSRSQSVVKDRPKTVQDWCNLGRLTAQSPTVLGRLLPTSGAPGPAQRESALH